MMRQAAARLAGVLMLVTLAACGPARPHVHTVVIDNMAFGPPPAGLHVGDAVEWVNADMFEHSATAADGGFDLDLKPQARARAVLVHAGPVEVRCRYHPGMTTRLSVAP